MLGNLMDRLTTRLIDVISEFPLLFSFLCGGMGRRGASLFPSLRRRERSEFHGSKLDGGRKGGITAFSLSLGSRVKGAPVLSIVVMRKSSFSEDVLPRPESLLLTAQAVLTSVPPSDGLGASAPLDTAGDFLFAFIVASSEVSASSGNGTRRLDDRPCLSV